MLCYAMLICVMLRHVMLFILCGNQVIMQLQSDVQQCLDDIAVAEEDALPGIKQNIVKLMEHMAPLAGQVDAINTSIMEVCASVRSTVND